MIGGMVIVDVVVRIFRKKKSGMVVGIFLVLVFKGILGSVVYLVFKVGFSNYLDVI